MIKFLDLHAQYVSIRDEIDAAIAAAIAESAFVGGTPVREFEEAFACYQDASHCVGVGNGTDSLEIILEALALPAGGEVIVPANSFIATSEAVTRAGLRVVFADVDPNTYTLSVETLAPRITPSTIAIIAVHLYGYPAPMDEIMHLAQTHGLRVIEDAAQAHGAEIGGRRVGALGDAGSFSFYPGKNLGAYGDGGAIVTANAALAERCRMIANHGRLAKYDHAIEGRNSRLDALQAAILKVKLNHLESWIERRNTVARVYLKQLDGVPGIALPVLPDNGRHAFHLFVIRTAYREALRRHLSERGIETGIHYPIALPKLAAYRYLGEPDLTMFANQADETLLSLPIGDHMTVADAERVAVGVRDFATIRR
jgi:dTDP-4-amino-4,6-dideoxygalactose transaminase